MNQAISWNGRACGGLTRWMWWYGDSWKSLKKTSFVATESENPLKRHYIVILNNLVFLDDENSIEMDIQNENSEISLSSRSYFVQWDFESFFNWFLKSHAWADKNCGFPCSHLYRSYRKIFHRVVGYNKGGAGVQNKFTVVRALTSLASMFDRSWTSDSLHVHHIGWFMPESFNMRIMK